MTIQTAIVGCGGAGVNQHIPVLEINPATELVALCDLDEVRVQDAAKGLDIATYTDIAEMVNSEDIDSVHLCTPPQTRAELTEILAPHVKGILYEKPLAHSSEAVKQLKEIVDAEGLVASVVHNKLFTPHYREALQRVSDGVVGDIVNVTMLSGGGGNPSETHRGDWVLDLPGGELGEGFPHEAYRTLAFVNGLDEVTAVTKFSFGEVGAVEFDGATLQARDESGRRSMMIGVHNNATTHDILHVIGTEGVLVIDGYLKGAFLKRRDGSDVEKVVRGSLEGAMQSVVNLVSVGTGFAKRMAYRKLGDEATSEQSNGHYVLIDEYVNALHGCNDVPVTLEEGHDTIRMMEAMEG